MWEYLLRLLAQTSLLRRRRLRLTALMGERACNSAATIDFIGQKKGFSAQNFRSHQRPDGPVAGLADVHALDGEVCAEPAQLVHEGCVEVEEAMPAAVCHGPDGVVRFPDALVGADAQAGPHVVIGRCIIVDVENLFKIFDIINNH